jgi:hypothetical protein
MTLRWKEGRILLPNGTGLDVSVRGAHADVRWLDGALELHRTGAYQDDAGMDRTIELVVRHAIANPEHIWVPHLTPEEGDVIGDAVFRSPAILIADDAIALAFIPDVDDVRDAVGWRAWLDYDHQASTLTLAAGSYQEHGHVFYERQPLPSRQGDAPLGPLRLHVLASQSGDDPRDPYGMAARFVWERWGRPGLDRAARPSITRMTRHIVRWAFSSDGWGDSVWQHVDLETAEGRTVSCGAPAFIVDVTRHPSVPPSERQWREPRSIWNQAWFSTQRSANGLLRYARQIGSADLEARARMMTEIALAAPQHDGLFPAVLLASDQEPPAWRWTNSDRRPDSVSDGACHIVDAAFTCRMLLDWFALTGDERAQTYVQRFADRLVRLQRPSGAFPGWVEPDGAVPPELAEGPESAVAVTLLLELGAFKPAALRALPFLEAVAREGRWEDFETYYSCARWGSSDQLGRRVARNGVYKQNTLAIAWCADAFLQAWRQTNERHLLDLARRCIDELSLYQAVWDPPWLPAPAHGGFGVMNGDCEWNDARQSLFAPLFLDLGREIGDRALVERGVSAVLASFSMLYCPENAGLARAYEARFPFFGSESYGFMMENQGHSRAEPLGTFTIFTWGNGSALATAALVRDRFPEIAREWGLDQ